MLKIARISTIVMILIACSSCVRHGYVTISGYAQGGMYTVKYNQDGLHVRESQVRAAVDSILNAVDFSLSGYNKASLLSRYNSGEDITPDRCFQEMLDISEYYKEITDGAFNAAAAPLFDIWGFGFTRDSLPSAEAIAEAMDICREGRKLNFNAVAQGYSCDLVAEYLHSIGVHDMLVDIGEIYCEGFNPSGKGWSIGIDTPTDGNNSPGASLSGIWQSDGRGCGIVTSGNYRKFYMHDGRKFSHTIDPRTGYPVEHNLLSATVVASTGTEADALATFFMVIGEEEARQFVSSHKGIECCLITSDSLWRTPGFNML